MWEHGFHGIPVEGLIAAAIELALAVAIDRLFVLALDRALKLREAQSRNRETLDSFLTRIAVLRRLGRLAIYLVGVSMALSHFPLLRSLSTGLWASAGVAGLVVGMAAKGTLGNAIAGVTLAFSQPFRIGDGVTLRNDYGVIEEITLIYTLIRTTDNRLLVIPNDVLSTEVFYNHSLLDPRILTTVKFYVAYGVDLAQAMRALAEAANASPNRLVVGDAASVTVGETLPAAIRLDVSVWAASQAKAFDLQTDVRARGLAALGALKAFPKQLPTSPNA
jgi:small conductance mechanosensitive channel